MKTFVKSVILGIALVLTASCCGQPELSGKWNILTVNGEEVKLVGEDERVPFIEFNTEENRVHGFAGCNIMNGSYTLEKSELKFGQMITTMMAGPEENMNVERSILAAVGSVVKAKQASDKLQLLDASGKVVLELAK